MWKNMICITWLNRSHMIEEFKGFSLGDLRLNAAQSLSPKKEKGKEYDFSPREVFDAGNWN